MTFVPLGQKVVEPEAPKSTYGKFSDALGNFSEGVVKGGLSTLQGAGSLVTKGLDQTVGRVTNVISGKGFTPTNTDYSVVPGMEGERTKQLLEPQGTAQKVGKTTEQIAEFFVPASRVAKAENVINTLTQGFSKIGGAVARVSGKAAVNAIADTAVATAQTGDIEQGLETGAMGGAFRGALGVVGETARAFRIPERLYQTVFKNAGRDMMAEFKTDYLVDLYKTRPHIFNDLVDQGIVKMDGGAPVLNTTMAEEALARGLKGSIPAMGKQVAGDLLQNEAQVRQVVKGYKGSVGLEQPQFFNILREISSEYKNVGFGEISKDADTLAHAWLDGKGKVSGETALAIRRLLDKARLARSFDVPVTKLSMSQANLKTLADEARSRLNQIPGLQPIMDDYSFNMDALEDLAKEGARRGNNQIFSLIDSIFLGGGVSSGNVPTAVTLATLRKYIQSGRGATTLGTAIKNPNASAKTVGAIGAGASLLEGATQPQSTPQVPKSRGSFVPYTPSN